MFPINETIPQSRLVMIRASEPSSFFKLISAPLFIRISEVSSAPKIPVIMSAVVFLLSQMSGSPPESSINSTIPE